MEKHSALGNIFIISAASGTGKTTLVSRLTSQYEDIQVAVSHTTRAPRNGEQDGKHYHFIDAPTFERMIGEGGFLEFANVYGNYYGTSHQELDRLTAKGVNVILEIDIQGAQQVRRLLPHACSIFIAPPSFAELAARLKQRGTDGPEVIQTRLDKARAEIEEGYLFDYVVFNDTLIMAEMALVHIIRSQVYRQSQQEKMLTQLLANAQ